jgi:hypothetical protein
MTDSDHCNTCLCYQKDHNRRCWAALNVVSAAIFFLGEKCGLGNQKVFGVFPYGCTICAGIKNAPCGDSGGGECKSGSESKPDVLCQYQMNEPTGLVEVLLLPK